MTMRTSDGPEEDDAGVCANEGCGRPAEESASATPAAWSGRSFTGRQRAESGRARGAAGGGARAGERAAEPSPSRDVTRGEAVESARRSAMTTPDPDDTSPHRRQTDPSARAARRRLATGSPA